MTFKGSGGDFILRVLVLRGSVFEFLIESSIRLEGVDMEAFESGSSIQEAPSPNRQDLKPFGNNSTGWVS